MNMMAAILGRAGLFNLGPLHLDGPFNLGPLKNVVIGILFIFSVNFTINSYYNLFVSVSLVLLIKLLIKKR